MNTQRKIVYSIIAVLTLVVITLATTYAIFTYSKTGEIESKVIAGTLKFSYTENTGVGAGISLSNAFPVSDSIGKTYDEEGKVFDFSIESTNTSKDVIPYEVTFRKKKSSTLDGGVIKVYLTDITSGTEVELLEPTIYNNLNQTSVDVGNETEKAIYSGTVSGSSSNHSKKFRLRIWIDENTDFSGVEQEDGTMVYPYNGKTFIGTVNVYANPNYIYADSILNGADPVLKDSLVPVVIDNTGKVTKADMTEKWYSYSDKEWANAVILKDSIQDLKDSNSIHEAVINDNYVSFDGKDDFINLGYANYDFNNQVSLVARVKFNELEYQEYLGNWEGGGCGLALNANNRIEAQFYIEEKSTYYMVPSTQTADLGKYYTIVATYDGNTIYLYVDGVLVGKEDVSGNIKVSAAPFYIGANPVSNSTSITNPSSASVEQVAIYSKTLTAEEIKENFSGRVSASDSTNLLTYVDFRTNPNVNEEIPELSIESYFVWIPKYSYKIFDLGNYTELTSIESKEQKINIKFGLLNTDDSNDGECTTPGTTGASGNCQVGDYMTHPSFLAFDSNGFWVGKFETGYDGATSTEEAQTNTDTVDTSKIVIKPNTYSWRNIKVGNIFKNGYDYNRSLDSHAIKNTEWGAVAYLQHSAYGSATSVRSNNNSAYITGYAATEEPTKGNNTNYESIDGNRNESTLLGVDGTYTKNYLNSTSTVASTTGNYTGIYDMSGGAIEYAMGYDTNAITVGGSSGITNLYSNFFTDSNYTKYWDKYSSTINTNYSTRILGDATGEMGPFGNQTDPDSSSRKINSWYGDRGDFIYSYNPWLTRGNFWGNGKSAGIFAFSHYSGNARALEGFRIVLTPTK